MEKIKQNSEFWQGGCPWGQSQFLTQNLHMCIEWAQRTPECGREERRWKRKDLLKTNLTSVHIVERRLLYSWDIKLRDTGGPEPSK